MTSRLDDTVESSEVTAKSAYERAHERAEMIQGFYIHVIVYAVINLGLFLLNVFTRGEDGGWWFMWPLLGWGIGLFVHLVVTMAPVFSPEWADRRAERMLEERGHR